MLSCQKKTKPMTNTRHLKHTSYLTVSVYPSTLTNAASAVSRWTHKPYNIDIDLVRYFFVGDVIIFYPRQLILKLIQFVVVRGKKRFGSRGRSVQEFDDTPCNGNTIIRRSSAADFIEQYQAAW